MKVLIADDDPVSRRLLEATLTGTGYEVFVAEDGTAAWDRLQGTEGIRLAVLDWMMPGMDGVELCRRIRGRSASSYVYTLLLTSRGGNEDVVHGLDAGADDYVTKPYDPRELLSRVRVGVRILDLETALESKIGELAAALENVKRLEGLLPICMYCKKIRDVANSWQKIEDYISQHSGAIFSHSLCKDCFVLHYPQIAAGRTR